MLNKILSLSLVFFFATNLFGQSSYLQLNKCWELSREDLLNDWIASDNEIIIIPTINSNIFAINIKNNLLWSNESNGELVSKIIIIQNNFFYLTKNSNTNGLFLNSVSKQTGLINWVKEISRNKELEITDLFSIKERPIIITKTGNLLLFDSNNEKIDSETILPNFPSTNVIQSDDTFYYINSEEQLTRYSITTRKTDNIITTKSSENILFSINQSEILLGDNRGEIKKIDALNKKILWSVRTGGQITSVIKIADEYLVSSIDNYLYLINSKNGGFKWRKRLNGRTIGGLERLNSVYISPIINTNLLLFSEISKGKTVNQVNLPENDFFTGKPIIIGENIIIPTNRGLFNYKLGKC